METTSHINGPHSLETRENQVDYEIINRPFEVRAEAVLAACFIGIHHCPEIKKASDSWSTNIFSGQLSTFDYDQLTRLVFAAHKYCIRVSIHNSGPRLVKIIVSDRKTRVGGISERHPTLAEAIEYILPRI
jgi:hypothetical protein